jgi:lipid-binding SYLF domain-containing protein
MKSRRLVLILIGLLLLVPGCQRPKGATAAEKRAHVREMRDQTLNSFYKANPGLRQKVANAAGYAVFTNVSMKILVVSSGNGYGIAHDRNSGRDTYMRMLVLGGGFGMGLKDLRALFVFHNRAALQNFIAHGLEIGGQAEVAATVDDVGVAAGAQAQAGGSGATHGAGGKGGGTISEGSGAGYSIYRITEAGAAASATLEGTKYWKDESLN